MTEASQETVQQYTHHHDRAKLLPWRPGRPKHTSRGITIRVWKLDLANGAFDGQRLWLDTPVHLRSGG